MKRKVLSFLITFAFSLFVIGCGSVEKNDEVVNEAVEESDDENEVAPKIDVESEENDDADLELVASMDDSMKFDQVSVGDVVSFGRYEGKEIEWYVLEIGDGEAVLFSQDILWNTSYNEEPVDITWENCSLRAYLNGEFYNDSFDSSEKEMIQTVTNENADHPCYGTSGGNQTQDNVWLLSFDDLVKYMGVSEEIYVSYCNGQMGEEEFEEYCLATDSRLLPAHHGAATSWWSRTPGHKSFRAIRVAERIDQNGSQVNNYSGVRPAIRIRF